MALADPEQRFAIGSMRAFSDGQLAGNVQSVGDAPEGALSTLYAARKRYKQ